MIKKKEYPRQESHKTTEIDLTESKKKMFCIGMEVWVPLDPGVNVPREWQWVENINQFN